MLNNQTIDAMHKLRLPGMAAQYRDQTANPTLQALGFDDRIGLMVDAELNRRENRRIERLAKEARLKDTTASSEGIDFSAKRGLDKPQFMSLLTCDWIRHGQHLVITGATGTGKTWLACALGKEATRKGLPVGFHRFSNLMQDMEIAHGDGRLPQLRTRLAKPSLLILDDWALMSPFSARNRQDLLELVDDRVPGKSLLITTQLPIKAWHDYLGEPTVADAILDRILHNKHSIELVGESMRRKQGSPER